MGNHWNLRCSTEISHPKKKTRGSWSQKSSLPLGLIMKSIPDVDVFQNVAESVVFLAQMYEHKKNTCFVIEGIC